MTRRIVVIGSVLWKDRRQTMTALRRVVEVYKGPYVLVAGEREGASRYAAAGARELGWQVETQESMASKCGPECPPHHRRMGGPEGTYCPTARIRELRAMLDTDPDLVIALLTPGTNRAGTKSGQGDVKARGIALWTYEQKRGSRNGDETR